MQSFVDAAGEALGLIDDPLLTPIGIKVVEATNEEIGIESNELNMEICKLIQGTEGGQLQAVKAIKKRLQICVGKLENSTTLTLTLLELMVKECGDDFVLLVCQREFCDFLGYLVTSSSMKLSENTSTKILSLIQSWALAFSSDRKMRGVAEVYMSLKDKGINFPEPTDGDLKDTDEVEAYLKELENEIDHIGELEEDVYEEDSIQEEVTTEEFDKFLKKRVEAVQKKDTEEIAFSSNLDLKGIAEVYKALEDKGIELPAPTDEDLAETEEVEAWMEEHEKDESDDLCSSSKTEFENATTEDFNKFLQKRIQAVE